MAKKLLCIVLSVAMLLGVCAVAASAGDCYTHSSLEEAQEELAEQGWVSAYKSTVDYKDLIDRTFLTGITGTNFKKLPTTAASEAVLQQNLYFWADEIIAEYNSATTNREYYDLYNKMKTPKILGYDCEYCGWEYEVMYDFAYEYKAEDKAVMDVEIVADAEYAKAGDTITVEVFGTSNFATSTLKSGIFYDKRYLEPVSVAFDTETHSTWKEVQAQLDFANGGSDLRDLYWPAAMLTDENLAKYGVSHVFAQYNDDLDAGTYIHGMKFNGERIFTATYTVKEDVPEGTELEFFVPENVTLSMEDFLYNENNEKFAVWDFTHVVYEGTVDSQKFITTDNYRKIGQTVTANTATVTVGEEVVVEPEVKGDIVDIYTSAAFVGETTAVDVEVTGTPDILRVVSAEGTSVFTREDATIVPFNGNELWTIELLPVAEYTEYTVYADYGELGVTDGKTFYITAEVKADLGIHSIEIPDMYPNAQNGGVITAGKHDIIIKTSTDVVKVQFYDPADGTTYTYTSWSGAGKVPYEDIDGERVWTISHAFGPFGTNSLVIRTRSATTFFAATESTLDATVVY